MRGKLAWQGGERFAGEEKFFNGLKKRSYRKYYDSSIIITQSVE